MHLKRLVTHKDVFALVFLTLLSIFTVLNYWGDGSVPQWDGAIYDRLIADFSETGEINGDFLGTNQLRLSYTNRVTYITLLGGLRRITAVPPRTLYLLCNVLSLLCAAFFLFRLSDRYYRLSFCGSLSTGAWLITAPPVVIVHQVVAHPDPLMFAFLTAGFYLYKVERYILAALLICLAGLTKQSALAVLAFIVVESFFRSRSTPWREVLSYIAAGVIALVAPGFLVDNSSISFSLDISTNAIIRPLYGQLLPNLLYNFGVLWIPFLGSIALLRRSEQFGLCALTLAATLMFLAGATDWWRVWFSVLFILALPGAARTLESIFSDCSGQPLRPMVYAGITLLFVRSDPTLDLSRVNTLNISLVLPVAAFLVAACVARERSFLRSVSSSSFDTKGSAI